MIQGLTLQSDEQIIEELNGNGLHCIIIDNTFSGSYQQLLEDLFILPNMLVSYCNKNDLSYSLKVVRE